MLLALVLFALAVALYAPTTGFAFLNYDDDDYVTRNAAIQDGLDGEAVGWAFGGSFHAANWHPLTWISHALDVELFGLDAGAHHRTNNVLHALNAALWFLVLVRLFGRVWTSALLAAFFALHPLRVESVAWVAERKDLLAAAFWALALLAWSGFVRHGGKARYGLVLLTMAASLLCKPMAVTLPCLLLVLDRWPLQRPESAGRLVLEKLPLFALALGSAWITLVAQRAGQAMESLEELPFAARVANAVASYGIYLRQTLWPADLAVLYPHPGALDPERAFGAPELGHGALLLAISALAWMRRRAWPALGVGWLWYLGTLVPVIGIVQVGLQAHADRYTYVPTIGLTIAVGYTLAESVARNRTAARGVAVVGVLWLAGLAWASRAQIALWRDSRTLFEHAVERIPGNFVAHTNLANALESEGDLDGALEHFRAALAIRPDAPQLHYSVGTVLSAKGRFEEAMASYRRALELEPDLLDALLNAGVTLAGTGKRREALPLIERAWAHPRATTPYYRVPAGQVLAWILATSPEAELRDGGRAVEVAEATLAAGGANATLLEVLGAAYAEAGRFEEAIEAARRAYEVSPPSGLARLTEQRRMYAARQPFRLR